MSGRNRQRLPIGGGDENVPPPGPEDIILDDDDEEMDSDNGDAMSTATTIVSLPASAQDLEADSSSYPPSAGSSQKARLSIMSPIKHREKDRKPSLLDHMRKDDKVKDEKETSGEEDEDTPPVSFSPTPMAEDDEDGGGDGELLDESEQEDLKGKLLMIKGVPSVIIQIILIIFQNFIVSRSGRCRFSKSPSF